MFNENSAAPGRRISEADNIRNPQQENDDLISKYKKTLPKDQPGIYRGVTSRDEIARRAVMMRANDAVRLLVQEARLADLDEAGPLPPDLAQKVRDFLVSNLRNYVSTQVETEQGPEDDSAMKQQIDEVDALIRRYRTQIHEEDRAQGLAP